MSRYLILAMHSITPINRPACKILLSALDRVVRASKSLLIVPNLYHDPTARQSGRSCRVMNECLTGDDGLVLHDYAYLDDQPSGSPIDQLIHARYTVSEEEFSAIPLAAARARIQAGATWFTASGWSLYGFVALIWLMNPATWEVLDGLLLRYTTTLQRFCLLHPRQSFKAPCLIYSARSSAHRLVSRYYLCWLTQRHTEAPLLHLGPRPVDAIHPDVIHRWQGLPAVCLETRTPVTKNGFAQVLAQTWMDGPRTTVTEQTQTSY